MAKKITKVASIIVANEVRTGATKAKPQGYPIEPGLAKAWINFNGTGTIAIRDSFNVSGIVDNGTGHYTITLDTDFTSADYSAQASIRNTVSSDYASLAQEGQTSGALHVRSFQSNGGFVDVNLVSVVAFGDQ